MRTVLGVLGATMLLAACGGDDERRDTPAALLFDDLAAAQHGGWRSVGLDLVQSTPGAGTLCGYTSVPTLRAIESDLREAGGTVTQSSADKWCGETASRDTRLASTMRSSPEPVTSTVPPCTVVWVPTTSSGLSWPGTTW